MANYLAPEDDPVNYLPARVNPNLAAQGRRYNLAERQQTSPLMQAGNVQFAKELASMGNRGAIPDLINRGLIANTAGLPVDMLNTVLQTLGLGSEQPLGGSDSIRRALEFYGLSSETQRPMLETLTSLTPPKAVMGAARVAGQGAEAVGRAAAPVAGQALENYMVRTGGILPMVTYHGTPHRFPPTAKNPLGEFDAAKIGTGEGAQAYGHGLYLAENPGVATDYAKTLGPKTALSNPEYVAAQTRLAKFEDAVSKRYKQDALSPMEDIAFYSEKYPKRVINAADKIQTAEQAAYEKASKGNLYKVDLPDEQIAKMLDWDKPLSQQVDLGQKISPESLGLTYKQLENGNHAFVNSEGKILGNLQKNGSKESFTKNWIENVLQGSGRDLYNQLGQGMGGGAKVSEALRQAGIPGIRYLDGGSRAGGQGTSNFVVFDPAHMNIIGRE